MRHCFPLILLLVFVLNLRRFRHIHQELRQRRRLHCLQHQHHQPPQKNSPGPALRQRHGRACARSLAALKKCNVLHQVPAATQALAVIDILSGADGTTRGADKIAKLRRNTRMFREGLKMMVRNARERGCRRGSVSSARARVICFVFVRVICFGAGLRSDWRCPVARLSNDAVQSRQDAGERPPPLAILLILRVEFNTAAAPLQQH